MLLFTKLIPYLRHLFVTWKIRIFLFLFLEKFIKLLTDGRNFNNKTTSIIDFGNYAVFIKMNLWILFDNLT